MEGGWRAGKRKTQRGTGRGVAGRGDAGGREWRRRSGREFFYRCRRDADKAAVAARVAWRAARGADIGASGWAGVAEMSNEVATGAGWDM